jgi:hypothetical protein
MIYFEKERMKKAWIVLGCLALLFYVSIDKASAASFAIKQLTASLGTDKGVTVPINMTLDAGQQVAALQLDISYDSSRLFLGEAVVGSAASVKGKQVSYAEIEPGKTRVMIYGVAQDTNTVPLVDQPSQTAMNAGTICEIMFKFRPGATVGSIPLTLSDVIACDKDAVLIPSISVSANVLIELEGFAADLSNLKVYPNPFKPSKGHNQIVFANLPQNTSVKIYSITGELVREIKGQLGGVSSWDGTNDSGNSVASGVYIYQVSSAAGQSKKGKIVLVK